VQSIENGVPRASARVQSKLEIRQDDPIFRLHELAEPLGPLTNAQIDAAIYGK